MLLTFAQFETKAARICPLLSESSSHLPTSQQRLLTCVCMLADLPAPESGRPVPRVITFQRKRANRRVINEDQLVRMLREFAEVTFTLAAAVCPAFLF